MTEQTEASSVGCRPYMLLPEIKTSFSTRLETMKNKPIKAKRPSILKGAKSVQNDAIKGEFNQKLTKEESDHYYNLYNCGEVEDDIEELKESKKKQEYLQTEFKKTKYAEKGAFRVFYSKMHRSEEFHRKGVNSLITPSFNFIKATKNILIVPNPVALVKREGEDSKIEMNSHRLGDDYIKCLSKSLAVSDHVTDLILSKNRLTDASVVPLMNTIQDNKPLLKRLVQFDLSYNKIGNTGALEISRYLNHSDCNLEYLNLEANCLGNDNTNKILDSLINNLFSKIRYVNLAQNNLNDDIASKLATLVSSCEYLTVLILYQNQFKNYGAGLIMSELKKHLRIKIVDLSWNLIGNNLSEEVPKVEELIKASKNPQSSFNNAILEELQTSMQYRKLGSLPPVKNTSESFFCKELCELFHNKDTEMLHLDISYNNINYTDACKISEHIKFNHTILGIHVDGNDMEVDELGFVYPIDKSNYKQNHFANSQIFYRIGNSHPLIKTNIINVQKIRGKNNCWICEGWKEVKFHYKPHNFEGDINSAVVKLHLNFEGYKPYDTVLRQDWFMCHRMCPPGNLNFYFTMNGIPVENYGQMTHELKDAIVHTQPVKEDDDDNEDEESIEKEPKQFIITKVAQTHVTVNPEVISSVGFLKMIKYCEPRPEKKINKKKRPRTPWTFPISIWAYYKYNYEGDTEDLINEAFEFDFNRGQYSKDKDLTEEQEKELKEILRERYPKILDSYKNLSSYLGWRIWQIGQNQITEFASSCPGLLDSKYLINDVLVKVTEVKSNIVDKEERKKNQNIPDNIIRHQWMMLLVKIAKDKYFRTKQIASIPESVKVSFDTHYNSYINQFNNHKWRIDRYYNEYVDNVIKAYIPIFDAVFRSWAPQKIIGRDSNWMWLEEFTNVCNALMDTDFPVKEIPTIYNLSMRTQVDEINKDFHINMRFPEFLEAFSRFVDRLSPVPLGENKSEWTMQQRQEQHLSVKLESMIPSMMKLIKSDLRAVKDKFQLPSRDEESGLLVIDYTNPFYGKLLPPQRAKGKRKTVKLE